MQTGTRVIYSIKGDWRYEDFFFEELWPYVEKKDIGLGRKQ